MRYTRHEYGTVIEMSEGTRPLGHISVDRRLIIEVGFKKWNLRVLLESIALV
jgi:hypothetical protein